MTATKYSLEELLENLIFTGRNEVLAKVIFLHLFVILFTGEGGVWQGEPSPGPGTPPDQVLPPGTRYTPQDQVPPRPGTPRARYPVGPGTPLGPGTPPGTRYTPWDQVPPGPGTPPGQVHPPRTRYPPGAGTPQTRYPRGTRYPPWDQVPPGPGTSPRSSKLQNTVNDRPVRILLEWILVTSFYFAKISFSKRVINAMKCDMNCLNHSQKVTRQVFDF